jgi:hypothetical protein
MQAWRADRQDSWYVSPVNRHRERTEDSHSQISKGQGNAALLAGDNELKAV